MSVELFDPPRPGIRTSGIPAPVIHERRRRRSHVLPVALAVSAVLHLLLFATLRFHLPLGGGSGVPTPVSPPAGTEVVVLRIVEEEAVEPGEAPEAPVELAPVARPPVSTPEPVIPFLEPARIPTVAERLAPRNLDPQLFAFSEPLPLPMTSEEAALLRLSEEFAALADSMVAGRNRAEAALDWTVKDGEGRRWGVSPDGIHLGTITLPLPQLGSSAEMRERARIWGALQYQAARYDLDVTLEARVKAMRARRDAQRDSLRGSGGG